MATTTLSPVSTVSTAKLPATGTVGDVSGSLPYGVYSGEAEFLTGAAQQVAYVYNKLGGDILDIEIKAANIYGAYEEACLEYSYLLNIHQSKNILSDVLGAQTGTFDHKGEMIDGDLKDSLSGSHVGLKYPLFDYAYARRVADGISQEANVGGSTNVYSASFDIVSLQQDYDLQEIIEAASAAGGLKFPIASAAGSFCSRSLSEIGQSQWRQQKHKNQAKLEYKTQGGPPVSVRKHLELTSWKHGIRNEVR